MNENQFKHLESVEARPITISISDLTCHKGKTLIWGYTAERDSFHVYLFDRKIHVYCYMLDLKTIYYAAATEVRIEDCLPNKRIYPEACDYEFCRRLKERGVYLPFTTWDGARKWQQFHGKLHEATT